MKHIPYIFIIILLVVIIFLEGKNRRLEREKYLSKEHDFEQQLQQTESELEATRRSRIIANRVSDSLNLHIQTLTAKLKAKDREIASIKGRYNSIPVDSLAEIMEGRANARSFN